MAKLQVEAIVNGSVIDHIPAGQGINILKHFKMLDTQRSGAKITVGFNLPSKTMGLKDLIKVENRRLDQSQVNQLAILAPGATVNIIEESRVVTKYRPEIPDHISNVYKCPNSNCISNHEHVPTTFFVLRRATGLKLKCKYCEKIFDKDVVSQTLNNR